MVTLIIMLTVEQSLVYVGRNEVNIGESPLQHHSHNIIIYVLFRYVTSNSKKVK